MSGVDQGGLGGTWPYKLSSLTAVNHSELNTQIKMKFALVVRSQLNNHISNIMIFYRFALPPSLLPSQRPSPRLRLTLLFCTAPMAMVSIIPTLTLVSTTTDMLATPMLTMERGQFFRILIDLRFSAVLMLIRSEYF